MKETVMQNYLSSPETSLPHFPPTNKKGTIYHAFTVYIGLGMIKNIYNNNISPVLDKTD